MKICAAQTRPLTGDISGNIGNHVKLIELAVAGQADLIIFPELSLTGYEPTLAARLATTIDDPRLSVFQDISNASAISVGVGIPTRVASGTCISMIIFQPLTQRQVYSKKYLHADEDPFFVSGENFPVLHVSNSRIALAICYELSIPDHSEKAFAGGGQIYFASVAKTARGVGKAHQQLSDIAKKYAATTLMSNCFGVNDGEACAGGSAVWNDQGMLITQLNDMTEGLIIHDTVTGEVVIKTV